MSVIHDKLTYSNQGYIFIFMTPNINLKKDINPKIYQGNKNMKNIIMLVCMFDRYLFWEIRKPYIISDNIFMVMT